jgi:hypothetical protein
MRCDQCERTDDDVVELSTGLRIHPACFEDLDEATVDRVFSPGGVPPRRPGRVSCVLGPQCPCEGPKRSDWPMPESPAVFFTVSIERARRKRISYEGPDRFMLENLKMAYWGVE